MKNLIPALICLFLVIPCSAEIIIVDDDWPYDFDNIAEAIDYSDNGDFIFVFPGTYTADGSRGIDFHGKAITVRSIFPEDPDIVATTIVDCNGTSRGFYFNSGEDANSIIDGLTIINGFDFSGGGISCSHSSPTITNCIISGNSASREGGGIFCGYQSHPIITNCAINGNTAECGGGIYCRDSSPTITNCNISGNTSYSQGGGGICCHDSSSPTIVNCTFSENSAANSGGGIFNYDYSSPTLTNCTINGNTAQSGGGMYKYDSSPTLTNCILSGNSAGMHGAGIYNEGGSLTLTNCTLSGNTAEGFGGGICCCYSSPTTITNCTISGNSASEWGGGIFFDSDSMTLINCILWGNTVSTGTGESAQITYGVTPEVAYSCIQDDDPNDTYIPFNDQSDHSNIDDNPMFVRNPNDGGDGWGDNPETPDIDEGANDDFGDLHLQHSSPCINAGHPNFIPAPDSVDIDGQPRIIGLRVDMGVDEHAPIIVITRPEGGEVWASGSIHEITWDSYIYQDTVDILFSEDDGSNWETIESSVADTGSYIWYLPELVDSNQCLILIVPSVPDTNVACIESGLFTIHPDFIHPAVSSKWKSLGGDFTRTGLSEDYGPELGCVKWQFETDGPLSASATIGAGDRVHIACEDGKIYTLDSSDGSLLWSYDTNSPLLSSPTIGPGGSVYVGNKNGKLYAISIGGNLRWTHNTDGFIYSSPAVSEDGKVYVCSQDGTLYALGQDGSELWSFETGGFGAIGGSIFASPAIDANGTVYIAGLYDPNLYALDPNDGSVKLACNFESGGWPFASPVVAEDGTIYQTLLYDANLYAIDANNGNITWATNLSDTNSDWFEPYYVSEDPSIPPRYNVSDSGWSEPALGPDGTIYVSFDDPYLRAVDPNGDIKWVTQLGMMGGFTLTVGSDGLIYAASDDAHLCVVNPDGEEIARFEGYDWLSFPVIAADNTIIVSDANNTLWAIGGDDCEDRIPALHRPQDLNTDWGVNFKDFALIAADWLDCTDTEIYPQETEPRCDYSGDKIYLTGDVDRSLYVDSNDLVALAERWLSEE